MIDAENGIKPFEVIKECGSTFNKEKCHRAKKDKQYLFKSPYALIKKGFDTQNYKFRAAYSEEDFLYTDAITGICGNASDKRVLLSLTGIFNSSFYSYLNLMLGSSSGIEREQGFPTEIFRYPAIIDSKIANLVEQIQSAIKLERESFDNTSESEAFVQALDKLILNEFGLSNDIFIDYALNVQIPLVANNKLVWEKVNFEQLCNYANVFIEYFLNVLPQSEKYVSANIYRNIASHYCAVEIVFQDIKPVEPIIEYNGEQDIHMDFLSNFMLNKVNDLFYQMKDIINFTDNAFYILKTEESKNWHPAMAKLDLADVLDSILSGNEVSKS